MGILNKIRKWALRTVFSETVHEIAEDMAHDIIERKAIIATLSFLQFTTHKGNPWTCKDVDAMHRAIDGGADGANVYSLTHLIGDDDHLRMECSRFGKYSEFTYKYLGILSDVLGKEKMREWVKLFIENQDGRRLTAIEFFKGRFEPKPFAEATIPPPP